MLRALTGPAKAVCNELEVEALLTEAGADAIVAKLKEYYQPHLETAMPRAFERAVYGEARRNKESFGEFIVRQDALFRELREEGVTLDDTVRGYIMFRQANLSQTQEDQITTWTQGKFDRPAIMAALRKLEKVQRERGGGKHFLTAEEEPTEVPESDDDGEYIYLGEADLDQVFEEEELTEALATYQQVRQAIREQRNGRGYYQPKGLGKQPGGRFGKGSKSSQTSIKFGGKGTKVHIDVLKLRTRWAVDSRVMEEIAGKKKAIHVNGKTFHLGSSKTAMDKKETPPGTPVKTPSAKRAIKWPTTPGSPLTPPRNAEQLSTPKTAILECHCHAPAVQLIVKKEGPTQGRLFWKCAQRVCNFFEWDPQEVQEIQRRMLQEREDAEMRKWEEQEEADRQELVRKTMEMAEIRHQEVMDATRSQHSLEVETLKNQLLWMSAVAGEARMEEVFKSPVLQQEMMNKAMAMKEELTSEGAPVLPVPVPMAPPVLPAFPTALPPVLPRPLPLPIPVPSTATAPVLPAPPVAPVAPPVAAPVPVTALVAPPRVVPPKYGSVGFSKSTAPVFAKRPGPGIATTGVKLEEDLPLASKSAALPSRPVAVHGEKVETLERGLGVQRSFGVVEPPLVMKSEQLWAPPVASSGKGKGWKRRGKVLEDAFARPVKRRT
eukprot:g9694.t1